MGANLLDVRTEGRQFVDRYELIGEIASGGMATVFLARLTGVGGFQRLYALKRLHPHLQRESEFVEMFLDEARLAAGIHHPNVVPILEVGASQNSHYLVMEYIEGDTLAHLLASAASRKQRIPIPQVIRIALDTLSGLHAAHELRDEGGHLAGVVHRDVSPQNILVGVDGISRITDFGVARATSRLTDTRVGQLKGKIAYMAPEQARGEEHLDRRADVFAAGIVFWEALAHRRLFKAPNEAGTLSRVLLEPIPPLQQAAPQLSQGVCDVVMHALERDPRKRTASCAEFADELELAGYASGELGSSRHVLAYMHEVLGADIATHRDALRAWTAVADSQGPPPQLTPSRSVTNTGLETMGRMPRRKGEVPWLPRLLAALATVGLGYLGYVGYQSVLDDGRITIMGRSYSSLFGRSFSSMFSRSAETGSPAEAGAAAQLASIEGSSTADERHGDTLARQKKSQTAENEVKEDSGKVTDPLGDATKKPTAGVETKSPTQARPAPRARPSKSRRRKKRSSPIDALDSNPYR